MTNHILAHATQIGYKICKTAIRDEGRCTWISKDYHRESQSNTFAPMDAEFYKGLSGVALFLAALYSASPQAIFKETAIGAMRQALLLKGKIEDRHTFSFYRGLTGILFTLVKIQDYCQVNIFERDIKEIQQLLELADVKTSQIDIIEGLGSGLPTLIRLLKTNPSKELEQKIRTAGNHLVFLAKQSHRGVSWQTSNSVSNHNLTGFSHGTAGIAAALFRLYNVSGDDRYLDTALQAIDYENHHLSTRQSKSSASNEDTMQVTPFDWAHGYAGIAQTLLVAYHSTGLEAHKTQAIDALGHSFQHFSTTKLSSFDLSITNGIWGVTDALIEASMILKDPTFKDQAHTLLQSALQTFEKDGKHWGGNNKMTEEVPDFMISLGGIGYSMLRFIDGQKYSSVLCL